MNKLPTIATLAVTSFVVLASPAFAQGMAGPSHMANDTMKIDHKKPMKKSGMKHDGMAAPSGGMASGGMASDKMVAPAGGMNNANH